MFSRESRRDGKVVRMCSAEELLGLCMAHVDRAPTGRLQHGCKNAHTSHNTMGQALPAQMANALSGQVGWWKRRDANRGRRS